MYYYNKKLIDTPKKEIFNPKFESQEQPYKSQLMYKKVRSWLLIYITLYT